MVDSIFPVDAVGGSPSYSGRKLRQTGAVAFAGGTASRPLGARSGVRPGTPAGTVTVTSTTWTCGPFAGVADVESAAEAGPYQFAFDAAASGALTAANASNPRVDIVYVQVSDPAEGDGSSAPSVVRGYLAGVAATTPAAPATPARSFVIAQINVPKAGAGAPTVTWVAPYMAAAGGIVPTSGVSQYPASPYAGQVVDDATLGAPVRSDGSTWRQVGPFAQASGIANLTRTVSSGNFMTVTFPTGRFTQPPIVTVTKQYDTNAKEIPYVKSITTTSCVIGVYVGDGTAGSAGTFPLGWSAVQMTATSSAG